MNIIGRERRAQRELRQLLIQPNVLVFQQSVYRKSQVERSTFLEVNLCREVYMDMYPIPNVFRDRDRSFYSSKMVDEEKRYYVLFVIPVLNVQVTKLV
jgi:hypothetical protein